MEQAVHTVSSHSRVLLQVHNRGQVTLARAMALQVHSDTLWECKDEPLELWVACHMVHRWDLMDSRDQQAMALKARLHITASLARVLTQASSKPPTLSPHQDNRVARHLTQRNHILRLLLFLTPRVDHPISNPTCPHSPRGHCQAQLKGPHSLSHLILNPQSHSLASLPTSNNRVLLVRLRSSQVHSLPQDHRASPLTQDPHSLPHSNSRHSLSHHSSHKDTANIHKANL